MEANQLGFPQRAPPQIWANRSMVPPVREKVPLGKVVCPMGGAERCQKRGEIAIMRPETSGAIVAPLEKARPSVRGSSGAGEGAVVQEREQWCRRGSSGAGEGAVVQEREQWCRRGSSGAGEGAVVQEREQWCRRGSSGAGEGARPRKLRLAALLARNGGDRWNTALPPPPVKGLHGSDATRRCLGIDHLRDGLAGSGCMNCSIMPVAQRTTRLAMFEEPGAASSDTQPKQSSGGQCRETKRPSPMLLSLLHVSGVGSNVQICWGPQPGRRAAAGPPDEDDAISVAASDTQFQDTDAVNEPLDGYSEASAFTSHSESSHGGEEDTAAASLRVALARLRLDALAVPAVPQRPIKRASRFRNDRPRIPGEEEPEEESEEEEPEGEEPEEESEEEEPEEAEPEEAGLKWSWSEAWSDPRQSHRGRSQRRRRRGQRRRRDQTHEPPDSGGSVCASGERERGRERKERERERERKEREERGGGG
ncbi:hypothetical protein WMY93_031958 [Mugilogobius chulae]|uniref:Uncharacterized protein n=1 Tax=Mugilogobius chulae TaxID=88201 RepID=A0AAW0ML75_9GOBI